MKYIVTIVEINIKTS